MVTDGDPDCVESTKEAIADSNAIGIKTFAIGIKGFVRGFDDADFATIEDIDQLLVALTKDLKHAFIA